MNYKGVCGAAQATPGRLKSTKEMNKKCLEVIFRISGAYK